MGSGSPFTAEELVRELVDGELELEELSAAELWELWHELRALAGSVERQLKTRSDDDGE